MKQSRFVLTIVVSFFTLMFAAPVMANQTLGELVSSQVSSESSDTVFVYISGGDKKDGESCYGLAEGILGRDKPSFVAEQAMKACYNNGCRNCRTPMVFGGVF